jgi:hypothetical protein
MTVNLWIHKRVQIPVNYFYSNTVSMFMTFHLSILCQLTVKTFFFLLSQNKTYASIEQD